MNWEQPTYTEIKMDAEIGSYQEDGEPPPERYMNDTNEESSLASPS